ncbi:Cyclic di-GMP phosphodiesterase response regulator RpfG [Caloramator mitchellensis]|uniref:Cyclic di-GMP phosphodiesterase response regulator RpfG n=1 Tax=Caloramator mitchellensis TaxID=908809 RepID=A0A0R3K156_CALMK|nr:HD-GYP domain-containing protein [Caloramator mitchellensis]KRQ86661.1 Cyclic di-GMP phosphodiesterase response regulator RpfG [Caloramator mitchellensis]
MKKIKINVSDCCIGDKLAYDVILESGITLLTEGTVLNEFIINKLENLGIERIYIYSDFEESVSQKELHFAELSNDYSEKVETIKDIINDLAIGKKLDYPSIVEITHDLVKNIDEKDNIVKLLSTLKAFNQYTYNHCLNVSLYSLLLGKWLGLKEGMLNELLQAAVMHDIGKAKIPDEILNKRGSLNRGEFEIMKKHSQYGYEIAKEDRRISLEVLKGILLHHEKEDGSGYPLKVKGDKISLFAKIIAICDIYDALTQERVYKGRTTPFEAFKIIEIEGYTKLDTKIMLTFLQNIASYCIGMNVVLSDGRVGEIAFISPRNIYTPIVKVDSEVIDLMTNKNINIVSLKN